MLCTDTRIATGADFVYPKTRGTRPPGTDRLNPQWYTESMGQVPYNPPNVSGWRSNAAWT